jgi:transketolase
MDYVVALCADLTESTMMSMFRDAYPNRFVNAGVAEQNLVTVASGMSAMGMLPFVSSYAAFSPGRNWEQIRTTICLNDRPVIIVGSHAGLNVGPDGATHQMLEDLALMRVVPNMNVLAPGDSREAEQATLALAREKRPAYIRLMRDSTPTITSREYQFALGRGSIVKSGRDISICSTGSMTWQVMRAVELIEQADDSVSAEVLHFPTIKPLDSSLLVQSASRTRLVLTVEEAQIAGGFGGAVAETLSEACPTRVKRLGVRDGFGQSGRPDELLAHYGLDADGIAREILSLVRTEKAKTFHGS